MEDQQTFTSQKLAVPLPAPTAIGRSAPWMLLVNAVIRQALWVPRHWNVRFGPEADIGEISEKLSLRGSQLRGRRTAIARHRSSSRQSFRGRARVG